MALSTDTRPGETGTATQRARLPARAHPVTGHSSATSSRPEMKPFHAP
jgi:hypothetical protein